jgi:chromosome segregation ATPase
MMQKMKQDMEAEKAAMQTQFDAQKKELEDKLKIKEDELTYAKKKLAKSERKNKILEADLKKLKLDKDAVDEKLLQTQARLEITQKNLDDLKVQYQQAQADLKFNDSQRKTLTNNISKANKSVDECQVKNTKLHQFSTELINIYQNPSTYEATMRKEQFFQLKRVELENILQGYQDKVDDERYENYKTSH